MTAPATLDQWLAHCERLHMRTIDMGLQRVALLRDRLGIAFRVPVVVVAGTNGKGSSCAMLESIALHAGYRVGLYTKPHLVHFEERCRIDGRPVVAADLLPHFAVVEAARGDTSLTWFEFTTLVILRLLSEAPIDLAILEIGLGGRLDAVNVIDADCALVTSIGLDHLEFLGPDREAIGFEKAHVMRADRPAVVSDPEPPASLVAHAARVGADLRLLGRDFDFRADRQQWSWSGRDRRYHGLAHPALRGAHQLCNAAGVLAVFEALGERLPVSAQAIREGLSTVALHGRFQVVPGQPAIVLDVAHNEPSVAALALNLDAMGFYPRTHAVFGVMRDKAIAALLVRIVPLVDHWHCCALPTPRAATADEVATEVEAALRASSEASSRGITVARHADPAAALRGALEGAGPADRIVVFGSFFTVGGVLAAGLPRSDAPHAARRGG